MSKCLYFLLLVVATQAYVTERSHQDIPAPRLTHITLLDDPSLSFKVDWTRVSTPQGEEQVQGYKVKVWQQPKTKTYRYETVNGVKRLVESYERSKFSNSDEVPTHKPKEILVDRADVTSALVNNIEAGVTYETRVLAYTKNGDGPLSQPMRIEVATSNNDRHRDVYNVD